MSYDSNGNNTEVIDSFGIKLAFLYGSSGQLKTIIGPASLIVSYAYKSTIDQDVLNEVSSYDQDRVYDPVLESVTFGNNTTPEEKYFYEDAVNKFSLTGILDKRGN